MPAVLVVDSEPSRRSELVRAIEQLGCFVLSTDRTSDALLVAANEVLDVVVADNDLDDQPGLDLLLAVSANVREPRRILIAGPAHRHLGIVAAETGEVFLSLQRPVGPKTLQLAVHLAIASLEDEQRMRGVREPEPTSTVLGARSKGKSHPETTVRAESFRGGESTPLSPPGQ